MIEIEDVVERVKRPKIKTLILLAFSIAVVLISFILAIISFYESETSIFPLHQELVIAEGETFAQIASNLQTQGYIHSALYLRIKQIVRSQPVILKAGTYQFSEPQNLESLLKVLTVGDPTDNSVTVIHKEGESVEVLALNLARSLPDFEKEKFIALTKPSEGKLFPDTYHLPLNYSPEEITKLLTDTFAEKIEPYMSQINESHLKLDEIIVLASIIEREANTEESMRMVSGILQNRLKIGMPLQVDASMEYVLNKPLKDLTADDLKIESPYNTYLNTGLPPTPIGNPGLLAIDAVLNPTDSNFLFYLTGNNGVFYYAEDFDQHRINIAKYLR